MKFFIVILLSLPFSVSASQSFCDIYSKVAEYTMQLRQIGYNPTELVAVIDKFADKEPESNLYKSLIIEAYEIPRFMSEDFQDNAVKDFRNEKYIECLREVLKRG